MMTSIQTNHHTLVEELRRRVLEGPGETLPAARQEAAKTAAGVSTVRHGYSDLARQIGESAHRVTDAQVASVLSVAGSQKAAFEIITAAALGAVCLSEIKHAHTNDGVRQEMALAQCDQRHVLFATSARPC